MGVRLEKVLADSGGVILRRDALASVSPHELAYAVQAGQVLRPLPRTFLLPGVPADPLAVIGAAITYAGVPAAVSHLSALRLWGLPVPDDAWVHLMTGETRHLRGAPGVRVHRREGFLLEPPDVLVRAALPVTRIEDAIVDSWPLLDGDAKRAPAITAVATRMTTPARLAEALQRAPRLAGRRHLVRLIGLLEAGCRSPLELWGHDHVFHGRELASLRRQVPVQLGGHTVYLDLLDERTRLNIELDGAAHHSSRQDRERDLRRDAALTALGFIVVRYSASRLLREPQLVRAEVLSMLAHHRR